MRQISLLKIILCTYLNHSITGILSDVVNAVPFTCRYQDMCSQYTSERINDLIKIGLFRTVNDMLLLDSTVIVREDIKSIRDYLEAKSHVWLIKLFVSKKKYIAASVLLRMVLMKNEPVSFVMRCCI